MLEKQLPYKYRVYDEIKKNILTGHYQPGSVLNERKLSEEMGISRTPIREALQMLEHDGWLITETYKGTVVREFDMEYLHNIMEIRTALEILAVQGAVKRIQPEDIRMLEEVQREQAEVLQNYDAMEFIGVDREFHSRLYEVSGNQELAHLLGNYYDIFQFLGMQAVLGSKARYTITMTEHQAILDALKEKDEEKAVRAMKEHMSQTEKNAMKNAHL